MSAEEKASFEAKAEAVTSDLGASVSVRHADTETTQRSGAWNAFCDGFKSHPDYPWQHLGRTQQQDVSAGTIIKETNNGGLKRSLKSRHLQMLAIGGSIGTGLFVGSGSSLNAGGPASMLIAYGVIGIAVYTIVYALGEMAVLFPISGSFSTYATRFIDPSWGFAVGWNYAALWILSLPLETVACTLTLQFWTHGNINNDAFVALFLAVVILINLFGVRGYGEAEFFIAIIKVIAVVGFILLGVILVSGGGPQQDQIGGRYWQDPGAFNNGFKGFCSIAVTAAFAFSGTELVGLAAAETENPRVALPKAVKQVFWRIFLFYIVSLTLLGLLVPYNDPRLINAESSADASASPFVIAVDNAGIAVLPSIINVVILISVLGVANSSIYAASRTVAALAASGQAPRILGYIDRQQRPLVAILAVSAFGVIAFIAGSSAQEDVFNWLLAISGLCGIFNWASICLCHIRMRKAWKVQGRKLRDMAFRSPTGVWGSYFGFILLCLVLVAQFWVGFAPIGYADMSVGERVQSFFLAYLSVPIIVIVFVVHKIVTRSQFVRAKDMDITTGLADYNLQDIIAEEEEERRSWSVGKKVIKFFC